MYFNEKHKQIVIDRGDNYTYIGTYKCGEITIDGKCCKSESIIRIRCSYCKTEYDVRLSSFKRGDKCSHCCNEYENSFAYYIQVELGESLNKYWGWEKNEVNPYLISKATHKHKIWIKCDKIDYYESYETTSHDFYRGRRCPYCDNKKVHPKDSFAQWGINTFGDDFLEKYWSPKNTLNPWKLAPRSTNEIWILCQEKDYHNELEGGYPTTPDIFHSGSGCPYCVNQKVHPKNSFGSVYPKKVKYWSPNNKKSPYEVSPKSPKIYKFICENCGEEFERSLLNLNFKNTGVVCRNCNNSELEQLTKDILQQYDIEFERNKEYEGLLGLGGRNLSYDFYLPNFNLLLELQGEQHEHYCKGLHKTKKGFERQLEHDKRKREYAKQHNIKLLEIWYYDIDNIENILVKELNLK